MTKGGDAALAALEERIEHHFADRELIRTALTHASASTGTSYQRLEFLGDRVLALVISEMLLEAFPGAAEGELAQRLTGLVRNESCADVAVELRFGEAIRLGGGEHQSGGRKKAAILGDVCEGVIGALYLDGGIEAARRFIGAHWSDRMLNWRGPLRDAKTTLQEWAQGRGLPTPNYAIVERSGPDHAPQFVVEVTVDNVLPGSGEGRSRREAEQAAATSVLVREGVWDRHERRREGGRGSPTRCGFVAIVGAPNAGKSTLVNRLVGTKVSIVSRKVQTTRAIVRGIALHDRAQIIFVDTPGIFAPRRRLDRAMVDTAWGGAHDADLVALLVDAARGIEEEVRSLLEKLGELGQRKILVLNKIDRVKREALLALAAEINGAQPFAETFMVSALTGDGLDDLMAYLAAAVPEGPFLYPEDEVTDLPVRQLAAEVTREKLFERLHQELPYAATVETDEWLEQKDGSVRISQTVFVTRDSHKKIVIGKGGAMIKSISTAARKEISEIAECPVHLFLFVKVREKWEDDPERYRVMGIEFPKG